MNRLLTLSLLAVLVFTVINSCFHAREIKTYEQKTRQAQEETAKWELKYKFYATQYEVLKNDYDKAIREVETMRTQHQLEALKK